jgi:hypothetical protein
MKSISPRKILTDGVMTGTSVITTEAISVSDIKSFAFQFTWTGTATGAFIIEGSVNGTDFATLPVTIAAAAGADTRVVDVPYTGIAVVRGKYTNATNTGVLQAWFCGKAV